MSTQINSWIYTLVYLFGMIWRVEQQWTYMYDSAATGILNFKVNALRTVIGNDIYNYNDSSFEVNKI